MIDRRTKTVTPRDCPDAKVFDKVLRKARWSPGLLVASIVDVDITVASP
ncbi:MAG: hypothetical protein AAF602_10175 [Myxococcota bacterium]